MNEISLIFIIGVVVLQLLKFSFIEAILTSGFIAIIMYLENILAEIRDLRKEIRRYGT